MSKIGSAIARPYFYAKRSRRIFSNRTRVAIERTKQGRRSQPRDMAVRARALSSAPVESYRLCGLRSVSPGRTGDSSRVWRLCCLWHSPGRGPCQIHSKLSASPVVRSSRFRLNKGRACQRSEAERCGTLIRLVSEANALFLPSCRHLRPPALRDSGGTGASAPAER